MEEPDLEHSDPDEPLLVEETDEILEQKLREREMRLEQLDNNSAEERKKDDHAGSASFLSDLMLDNDKIENYNWAFEDVVLISGRPNA